LLRLAAARLGEDAVTTRKPVNWAVFEGSDMIALRLRAARKPLVIDLLEIPPEEIDFEPVLIDPIELRDSDIQPIEPMIVPASEIQPEEDPEPRNEGGEGGSAPEAPVRSAVQPLFGVGWVEVKPGPGGA
jgi:hypothetical protein